MKKALIVGIDNYIGSPLDYCVKDAVIISTLLGTNGDGSPNFETVLQTDINSKAELRLGLRKLFEGDCDTALFYFSGHGIITESGGFIVTPDFKRGDEGILMDEILGLAAKSKIRNRVIILDTCHSGALGSETISQAKSLLTEGITILTASREYESAVELNGHSLFSGLLIEALKGGAADLRGQITPGSVYAFIDQALGEWNQRPTFKTNIVRFTSLRTIPPPVPLEALRRIIELFPIAQDEYQLDPSYEESNSLNVKEVKVTEPYADSNNVATFKILQKFHSVGLLVPVGADYMYYAAMDSKSCKLTALGWHYWNLVKNSKI